LKLSGLNRKYLKFMSLLMRHRDLGPTCTQLNMLADLIR
jgi:hypothetical protein